MRRTDRAGLASVLVAVATAVALAGCSPTVALKPADDAINVGCAEVVVRLPDTVAELPIRQTDAQGTGAWGEPASVILRCGVVVPGPTAALPCVTEGSIDWLVDDSNDPSFVFTTYGREPAVEVIIDNTVVAGVTALSDLEYAISFTTPNGRACEVPSSSADE
jgi:hypothetical protein